MDVVGRYASGVRVVFVVGVLGSIVGIGLHVWFEPWTSVVALFIGAIAGLFVSHAFGESLLVGLAFGCALTSLALGVRAFASVLRTLDRPPSVTSPRVWFSR